MPAGPELQDPRRPLSPYYDADGVTIYHGDCREALPGLTVAALVTDPPYNVGKDYVATGDDLDPAEYEVLMSRIANYGPPVQAWVTPTNRVALFARLLGDDVRPVVIRRGAKGPRRWGWYEQLLMVLIRGRPHTPISNLWENIRLKGEGYYFREETYGHPGYTPYPILSRLIAVLTQPGEVVLDPFAGTGTTLVAAKQLGRRAIGIEIEERYCEVAARRLAQGVLAL